jgi:SAM-dependent methyltransferase
MGVSSQVTRFRTALRTHGPLRTVRLLGSRLHREFFPPPLPIHPFDLRHGVDTSGLLFCDQLASGHAHDDHINAYWGTPPSGFQGILDHWQQALVGTPWSMEDYTFVDVGCGKGRVVLLASDLHFQRIVGVELNPTLTSIAEANLANWNASPHACNDIAILNVDALAAPIPDSPTVLYIYNSFNLYVMLPLLERLQALSLTRTAPIDLIYAQPQQANLVDATPGIAILATGSVELNSEDRAADAFASKTLAFRIYRFAGASNASVSTIPAQDSMAATR